MSYRDFPDWAATAPAAELERVQQRGASAMTGTFPCPECRAATPHAYARDPGRKATLEWLGQSGERDARVGRFVRCLVCDAVWAHHVGFRGCPATPEEMSRVLTI